MNTYFRFRQFTVHQDRCAMKVSTDACLFGAYIAEHLQHKAGGCTHTLDIGTGTGLLSLMLAQKCNTRIDAIEINEQAAGQARENFDHSPWAERLHLVTGDVNTYDPGSSYDCMISNPPFYENDLKSKDHTLNQARHSITLNHLQLLQVVKRHLRPDGWCCLLLPYHRFRQFSQLAGQEGFCLSYTLLMRQTPAHQYFRQAGIFSMSNSPAVQTAITIKDDSGQYTPEFTALLHAYYLYL